MTAREARPSPSTPPAPAVRIRAVALGYQGYANVGDEAILAGIEELLRGTPVQVTAVLGGPEQIPGFPRATRVHTPRQLPTLAALRALRRADLLLISGGGLFHDHWPSVAPRYLAWHLLARLAGTRVAWAGVGVGPLGTRLGRWSVGASARLAALVTVRDTASATLLSAVAPGVTPRVVPDPAIAHPRPDPSSDAARSGLGIILRAPAPADLAARGPLLAARLAGVAREAMAHRPVALLSFAGPADEAFLATVVAAAGGTAGTGPSVERLPPDPAAVLARLARLQAVVTVRLHGLILAALARTPAVPIVYDPKVAAWAEALGLADLAVDLDQLESTTPSELLRRVERAAEPARRQATEDRVAELRQRATVLRDAIMGVATAIPAARLRG